MVACARNKSGNAHPSRESVIAVTVHPAHSSENPKHKEDPMPVLMIALFALACFGLIGILLAAAVIFEPKKPADSDKQRSQRAPHKAA